MTWSASFRFCLAGPRSKMEVHCRVFDQDGSGAIGTEELGDAMKSLGIESSDRELRKLIEEIDADGNGEIDFEEFCACMKRLSIKKQTEEQFVRECYRVFDHDFQGYVHEHEFKRICVDIGGFPLSMADELFREVDVDGNGRVDYEEFEQMVRTYMLEDDEEDLPPEGSAATKLSI